ncbi:MAG: BPTI/Kunitz domain-containing protein [Candidatus Neomarinimicrobiota bacterium]|nr:BPTI/Kunitz domain-containing protein [Candidatus Neomarinimicrobiota bacterium]
MRRAVLLVILIILACDETPCWDANPDCKLEPQAGPCKGMFERHYFDQKSGKCAAFIWGGCGGVVPFESMEACLTACDCN